MRKLQTVVMTCLAVSVAWSQNLLAQKADAPSAGPVEFYACNYQEGKGPGDLDKANVAFNKWADKNDNKYGAWILSPQFKAGGLDFDFLWVGAWNSGADMGAGMDKWMNGGASGDVGEGFTEVMDCSAGHVLFTSVEVNAPDGPPADGLVWLSACYLADGKTGQDALAAHGKVAGAMSKMGVNSSSWAFFPALGMSEFDYDYLQVVAHKNYAHLGANYDKYYLGGGVQKAQAIMAGVASCKSPNLFDAKLVREAPES
jgi:hypothetical protein